MSLYDFLKLLKEKWYLLVIFPIVFGVFAAVYCWGFMPDLYTSNVTLYALQQSTDATSSTSATSSSSAIRNDFSTGATVAEDVLALAQSARVTDASAEDLGLISLEGYSIDLSEGDSDRVIKLAVTGTNPSQVAAVANSVAEQAQELASEVTNLQALNVIDYAKVPTEPSGPDRLKYLVVAILAGLFLAIVIIVIADMLNMSVRNSDEAEKEFGLPVVGNVPLVKKLR